MEGRGVNIALHVCPCSTSRRAGGEGRAERRGLDSSFTLAKHEIANDAYELKEAEDGTRTGTKRQIDLEIQVAQEDIAELRRQGLKGEEPKRLRILIAVLENEKSAMDPAAMKSLDPAAPAFVPSSSVPAPVSSSWATRSIPAVVLRSAAMSVPADDTGPASAVPPNPSTVVNHLPHVRLLWLNKLWLAPGLTWLTLRSYIIEPSLRDWRLSVSRKSSHRLSGYYSR